MTEPSESAAVAVSAAVPPLAIEFDDVASVTVGATFAVPDTIMLRTFDVVCAPRLS